MKLDKSKPYGQISGEHSAMFEQNGAFFDAHGDEVVGEDPAMPDDLPFNDLGNDTATTQTAPKAQRVKAVKAAPKAATGKKRGPKAAAEVKPTTPVDEQIAAQTGA